jgi:hypothetical protein
MPPSKQPLSERPCLICGAPFAPQNGRNVCCSYDCIRERKRRACAAWYLRNAERQKRAVCEARRRRKRKDAAGP